LVTVITILPWLLRTIYFSWKHCRCTMVRIY